MERRTDVVPTRRRGRARTRRPGYDVRRRSGLTRQPLQTLRKIESSHTWRLSARRCEKSLAPRRDIHARHAQEGPGKTAPRPPTPFRGTRLGRVSGVGDHAELPRRSLLSFGRFLWGNKVCGSSTAASPRTASRASKRVTVDAATAFACHCRVAVRTRLSRAAALRVAACRLPGPAKLVADAFGAERHERRL